MTTTIELISTIIISAILYFIAEYLYINNRE